MLPRGYRFARCECGHATNRHTPRHTGDVNVRTCDVEGCDCSRFRQAEPGHLPPKPQVAEPRVVSYVTEPRVVSYVLAFVPYPHGHPLSEDDESEQEYRLVISRSRSRVNECFEFTLYTPTLDVFGNAGFKKCSTERVRTGPLAFFLRHLFDADNHEEIVKAIGMKAFTPPADPDPEESEATP